MVKMEEIRSKAPSQNTKAPSSSPNALSNSKLGQSVSSFLDSSITTAAARVFGTVENKKSYMLFARDANFKIV